MVRSGKNQFGEEGIKAGEARRKAKEEGKKFYTGSTACKQCGSFEKYVVSCSCRPCIIRKGKWKLADKELMAPYRTKEKRALRTERYKKDGTKSRIQKRYSQTENGKIVNTNKAARYRSRKKGQLPENADMIKIYSIYEECRRMSEETGIAHDVDHIIPISKGGLHHQDNLQILTSSENKSKGDRLDYGVASKSD